MSKAGEEMVLELASLLGSGVVKTAAKDEEDSKPCKCGKKDCNCGCKGDSDKCKCKKDDKKKDKKASTITYAMQHLAKLASDLDDLGAEEASSLVDEALKIIVKNIERKAEFSDDEGPDDVSPEVTEVFEDEGLATGREEGMGSRTERSLQEPDDEDAAQPRQDDTPEGLGMGDFTGSGTVHEDKLDELFKNPDFRAKVKELMG